MTFPSDLCPPSAPFFGFMGCACAIIFANLGSSYGTAKAGVGVCAMGVLHPQLVMKSTIPTIMAGILGIYGLIVAVLLSGMIGQEYSLFNGFAHLASGLSTGFSALAAGICIGIVGDAGVRANARQQKLFVGMLLILIFGEALALYGLIVSLILSGKNNSTC
ncbi:putative V-type proton ATPase 16 kDa proteolipid subunit [Paratrimastix pyriformis]|uniref:V-type proton ATPase proteolipid subunit n=1 Tax=Paratrimastix pyriformis TaxID=342808 RepID=A0ABQ8UAF8_9EUKA|nr:putative V-type proton ATPase 16 kDa proteolipid subunit [Paratrimastix pyriformis]|eukprot:GAFH01005738.1.p1 GENE.GAFH01005738.1~~GAFH01005738.1.p1  ORF type:complete len:172 (-),score=24.06 GAFH01005738.1:87-572(-)